MWLFVSKLYLFLNINSYFNKSVWAVCVCTAFIIYCTPHPTILLFYGTFFIGITSSIDSQCARASYRQTHGIVSISMGGIFSNYSGSQYISGWHFKGSIQQNNFMFYKFWLDSKYFYFFNLIISCFIQIYFIYCCRNHKVLLDLIQILD